MAGKMGRHYATKSLKNGKKRDFMFFRRIKGKNQFFSL
jgi:hypothetical protein